jgi:protein TonB
VAFVAPEQPLAAIAGGEVVLAITVAESGQVSGVRTLRASPPFTELLVQAVQQWRFTPALATGAEATARPVPAEVLVAAAFRPPTLYNLPESGAAVVVPSPTGGTVPPVPTRTALPPYPPQALEDGIVVVEATLDAEGAIQETTIVGGRDGFQAAAIDAAVQWRFQPSLREGRPVPSFAYLVFGFRQPVTASGR